MSLPKNGAAVHFILSDLCSFPLCGVILEMVRD
jgi:hypothetical protein